MAKSVMTALSLSEFFDGFSREQLERIAEICEPATYNQGDVLIRESESTDELYLIGEGAIEILMNPSLVSAHETDAEQLVVAELLAGQAFGEIALVDQGIRSATARVSEDKTFVLRLTRENLMQLCEADHELGFKVMRNLAADLATKMRNANLTIRQYQLMLSGE